MDEEVDEDDREDPTRLLLELVPEMKDDDDDTTEEER